MADVIGIRDDMFIGEGHKYQKTFMDAVKEGYRDGHPGAAATLVNLQCDVDHPTSAWRIMLHIIHEFGGVENLKGKKIAMTWALLPQLRQAPVRAPGRHRPDDRFGMDVVLAHPEGYDVMPEVEEIARKNAAATGGSTRRSPPWRRPLTAPTSSIQELGPLRRHGAADPAVSGRRPGWHRRPREAAAGPERPAQELDLLRGHDAADEETARPCTSTACPPISPASPARRARWTTPCSTGTWCPLYKEASYKPYIIAAMIMMSKVKDPVSALMAWTPAASGSCSEIFGIFMFWRE